MFGKQHKRVWGRSAQQAEDCVAIPKKPGDGRWSLLQSDGFRLFHCPRRLLAANHKPNWRKLLDSVFMPARQDGCPEGLSGPFGEVFEGE